MRILILHRAPLWGSGSGTYVRKLAEEFVKTDQVGIVCPEDHSLKKVKIYQVKPPFPGVFYSHPEYPKAKKYSDMTNLELAQYISSFLQVAIKAVDDFRPDILHVQHASFLVWVADYIKSIYHLPFVVSIHGPDLNTALVDHRLKTLTKKTLSQASKIFPNSFDTKSRFLIIFGKTFLRKIRTIFPGVDLKLYPKDRKIKLIDKKYNLKGKKLVIYVGRLDKEKGVEYLIRAAKNINAEVYILGGGEYKQNLEELVKELNLTNVKFVAYLARENIEELREFYRRAHVVVVPSTVKEGLGLVILEAMACSTPVVVSRIGGIPNIVKEGKTGFLVRPRSHKEIAEKVNKILANDKLRTAMGERCRKLIEDKYTWAKAAGAIRDSFERSLQHIYHKEEKIEDFMSWLE